MASKTTLNARNLEALGAERLAVLLIEISTGSAANKRRLRIELAGINGTEDVAREVTKRLSAIERSRSKVGWRGVKALKRDLDTQRRVIVDTIAASDPGEALDVMWRMMGLAPSVLARCNDSNGTILAVFHLALADLATIAAAAAPDPRRLAESVFHALQTNSHGQFDGVIAALVPCLRPEGLEHLKVLLLEWGQAAADKPSLSARSRRDRTIRTGLEQIADAQGDVDGFIAQQSPQACTEPEVATQIARRLLQANRPVEALQAIGRSNPALTQRMPLAWETVYTDVLEALGRVDEAQAFRRAAFARSLDPVHLRAFLKRLPDFDDMEAEERAIAEASLYRDAHQALSFLTNWPDLNAAMKLVVSRHREFDGDRYELLSASAEVLEEKYPLAALVLLRVLIDFALDRARAARYPHAARHLQAAERLGRRVVDFGEFPTHAAYAAALRARHERKTGFWAAVSA